MTFPTWNIQDGVCAMTTRISPREHKPGLIFAAQCKVAADEGAVLLSQTSFSSQGPRSPLDLHCDSLMQWHLLWHVA